MIPKKIVTGILLVLPIAVVAFTTSAPSARGSDKDCGCAFSRATVTDTCFSCWDEEAEKRHIVTQGSNDNWRGNYHEGYGPGMCEKHSHIADCQPTEMEQLVAFVQSATMEEIDTFTMLSGGKFVYNMDRNAVQMMGGCRGDMIIGHIPVLGLQK